MTTPSHDEFRELLRAFMSSDDYLNDFMSQSHVMLFLKDVDNDKVLYVNQTVCDVMGKTFDEICGKPSRDNWPEYYADYHADDMQVAESGRPKFRFVEHMGRDDVGRCLITTKAPTQWCGARCVIVICVDAQSFFNSINLMVSRGHVGSVLDHEDRPAQLARMNQVLVNIRATKSRFDAAYESLHGGG